MNPLLRLLLLIFLGLPAAVLWCGGMLAVVAAATSLWTIPENMVTDGVILVSAGIFGGAAVSAFGWLMMMASVILSRGGEYRLDAKRLAPCARLEVAVCLLSALTVSCVIAAGSRWKWAELGPAWAPAIPSMLLGYAAIRLQKHAALRRKQWKEELRTNRLPS